MAACIRSCSGSRLHGRTGLHRSADRIRDLLAAAVQQNTHALFLQHHRPIQPPLRYQPLCIRFRAQMDYVEVGHGLHMHQQAVVSSPVHQPNVDAAHLSGEGIAEDEHEHNGSKEYEADGSPVTLELAHYPESHHPHPCRAGAHCPSAKRRKASSSLGSTSLMSRGSTSASISLTWPRRSSPTSTAPSFTEAG